jgi:hypothetical protein
VFGVHVSSIAYTVSMYIVYNRYRV